MKRAKKKAVWAVVLELRFPQHHHRLPRGVRSDYVQAAIEATGAVSGRVIRVKQIGDIFAQ